MRWNYFSSTVLGSAVVATEGRRVLYTTRPLNHSITRSIHSFIQLIVTLLPVALARRLELDTEEGLWDPGLEELSPSLLLSSEQHARRRWCIT